MCKQFADQMLYRYNHHVLTAKENIVMQPANQDNRYLKLAGCTKQQPNTGWPNRLSIK